ncbi:MAG TPA: hypothetical protein V6D22_15960 [Candidatus Obscuribacterales bacterium]
MAKLSQAFQFGRCRFAVEADDPQLIEWIESLFLPDNQPGAMLIVVKLSDFQCDEEFSSRSLQDQRSLMISGLLRRLYECHVDCIWMDAATVRSPNDKLVLLAGPSCAGKTTLALAMSLARGWKILSEDITLIDPVRNDVLACPTPSGMRAGTADKLVTFANLKEGISDREGWFFDKNLYFRKSMPAKFDMAVFLDPLDETDNTGACTMSVRALSAYEYIKSVLPYSNLLRLDDKIGVLYHAIENSRCLKLRRGSLPERVDFLSQVQQEVASSKEKL